MNSRINFECAFGKFDKLDQNFQLNIKIYFQIRSAFDFQVKYIKCLIIYIYLLHVFLLYFLAYTSK